MVGISGAGPFAVLLIGVIAIAGVLWFEFRRESRRLRRLQNLQTVLAESALRPDGEDYLKRAA